MAGITTLNRNGTITVYRTFSYRDSKNRPRNDKKIIAHKYEKTGEIIYSDYFLQLLKEQSISLYFIREIPFREIPKYVDFGSFLKTKTFLNTNKDIKNTNILKQYPSNNYILSGTLSDSSVKILGTHLLLDSVSREIGLTDILMKVFPDKWQEILTLSYFLVTTNESILYCQNWTENYFTYFEKPDLNYKKINDLLNDINYDHVINFFDLWMALQSENEYLALDISSISSYSSFFNDIEFCHNRDSDNLDLINFCMLFGEKSGLPVFSSLFAGNTNDVSTLQCYLSQIDFLSDKNYKIVLDETFYSQNNILLLSKMQDKCKFIINIPLNEKNSENIIAKGKDSFNNSEAFKINNDILFGYSFNQNFDDKNLLNYCVYYNNRLYSQERESKYNEAIYLRDKASLDPSKYILNKYYNDYLIFNKEESANNYNITINTEKIEQKLKNIGWLIVVTNDLTLSCNDIIDIYKTKYIIEKYFYRIKQNLGLHNLRIHDSKLFVTIISLIIISRIYSVMKKNKDIYKLTLTELLKSVEALKIIKSNYNITFTPLTAQCLDIFKSFNIKFDFKK
ncbi:MAG: transposase [Deltaproteobacteria bacterium]|jgi:transposase|nr:transposase [Deltaproteobacteria bacterium]